MKAIHIPDPYTLPPFDFVGGATQDLNFHCYYYLNKRKQDLSTCTANFSIINFVNKNGDPLVSKEMTIHEEMEADDGISNVLSTTLTPSDTVDLPPGKYIYQVSIKDINGEVEIPNQGIIHIINNINKGFVKA